MLTYSPIRSAASSDSPFSPTISFFTSSQGIWRSTSHRGSHTAQHQELLPIRLLTFTAGSTRWSYSNCTVMPCKSNTCWVCMEPSAPLVSIPLVSGPRGQYPTGHPLVSPCEQHAPYSSLHLLSAIQCDWGYTHSIVYKIYSGFPVIFMYL